MTLSSTICVHTFLSDFNSLRCCFYSTVKFKLLVVNVQVYGVKPDFLTCCLLGTRGLNLLFRIGSDEFITMNIAQSLLEVQANNSKASFRLLFTVFWISFFHFIFKKLDKFRIKIS